MSAQASARGQAARREEALPELARCEALLARHLVAVRRRFGSPGLGVIDLPPLSAPGRLDAEHLRAVAVLFWASQVEAAGLLAFVDALARGMVEGHLILPITTGGDALMEYWRDRRERFSVEERTALYARLFGAPGETDGVQAELSALVEALSEIGRAGTADSTRALEARANVVGRALAEQLSDRGAGMTAFAAREIVANLRAALKLLEDPDLKGALGGLPVWQALRANAVAVLGHAVEPEPHLARAKAGLGLIQWLADAAPALEEGTARIGRGDSVVQAAEAYRQAAGSP